MSAVAERAQAREWFASVLARGWGRVQELLDAGFSNDEASIITVDFVNRGWLVYDEQQQRASMRGEFAGGFGERLLLPLYDVEELYSRRVRRLPREAVDFVSRVWGRCHACKNIANARIEAIFDTNERHVEAALICGHCGYSESVETWRAHQERRMPLTAHDRERVRAFFASMELVGYGPNSPAQSEKRGPVSEPAIFESSPNEYEHEPVENEVANYEF